MSAADLPHDRSRLDGFEIELFQLVKGTATREQWKEWLRVPLEHAAAGGNVDLFSRLMDAGADSSAGWRGCGGRTLLGAAAYGGNEGIVSTLLEAGAQDDFNVLFGEEQASPLHAAIAQGAESVAETLMFAGADPNLPAGKDLSPLHLAAYARCHGIVGTLLRNGALPNARTIDQDTPLHMCVLRMGGPGTNDGSSSSSGSSSSNSSSSRSIAHCVFELLASGADKDASNSRGETPLFRAVVLQHPSAVELLLDAGANAELVPDQAIPLLVCAAGHNNAVILTLLLRHGCEVNRKHAEGPSALHHAAHKSENSDTVHALLDAGADMEARTRDNEIYWYPDGFTESYLTPLHVAALAGSTSTLRVLAERGANVNARANRGITALHIACRSSDLESVEILLRSGADESLQAEDGVTPADLVGEISDYDSDFARIVGDDNEPIRWVLARAPVDRAWRRRGWLVLCRSRLTDRAQVVSYGSRISSSAMEAGSEDSAGATWDGIDGNLAQMVGTLVGLKEEGLFRLVVSFV